MEQESDLTKKKLESKDSRIRLIFLLYEFGLYFNLINLERKIVKYSEYLTIKHLLRLRQIENRLV